MAFKLVGYGRRTAKRKGFSDDPEVCAERLAFAEEAIRWSPAIHILFSVVLFPVVQQVLVYSAREYLPGQGF